MRVVVVYRAFPEAVAEVQKIKPVALILLLTDGHQVVGEYSHLAASASPEHDDAWDVVRVVSTRGVPIQMQPAEKKTVNREVPAAGVISADVDILALKLLEELH